MGKVFRPSTREAAILSRIESSRERLKKQSLYLLRDCIDPLANAIAMKLVEDKLVETTSKNSLEDQLKKCLERLSRADDFEIDYATAPIRNLVPNPSLVSLYLTAFVIETLIDHKDVVDIFGSDEDIYLSIDRQVRKLLAV